MTRFRVSHALLFDLRYKRDFVCEAVEGTKLTRKVVAVMLLNKHKVDGQQYVYQRIKDEILLNPLGVENI